MPRGRCEFFCGPAIGSAADVLSAIDGKLCKLLPDLSRGLIVLNVLEALEALYFQKRGGVFERSVLLIDDASMAQLLVTPTKRELCEAHALHTVLWWVDEVGACELDTSRRGAVFTGLTTVSPWAQQVSGRDLVWLPLGAFDVWDEAVQRAISVEVQRMWPRVAAAPFWASWGSTLAATGGRPRDIVGLLEHLKKTQDGSIASADSLTQLNALYAVDEDAIFAAYLLPSLLGVEFSPFVRGMPTQFGRDAASSALLNADELATARAAVPAVSLRYVKSLRTSDDSCKCTMAALAWETASRFDEWGDFVRVWMLLTSAMLQLQFLARTDARFWPALGPGIVELGGPARPTAETIDVFAGNDRIEALFRRPEERRVFEADGAKIDRKVSLRKPPAFALWKDAWTLTIEPGVHGDAPIGLPMVCDVEWRPGSLIFFKDSSSDAFFRPWRLRKGDADEIAEEDPLALDFMLMVGEAGGAGDDEPHVYMFQCEALNSRNVPQAQIAGIARMLHEKLDVLFGASHASTHVLRLAGIRSARQVTLCVMAVNFDSKIDLEALGAPFNVVLFDIADFRALGGAAFRDTRFFSSSERK